MKRLAMSWEKIFTLHVNKDMLLFRLYGENSILKVTAGLSRNLLKKLQCPISNWQGIWKILIMGKMQIEDTFEIILRVVNSS